MLLRPTPGLGVVGNAAVTVGAAGAGVSSTSSEDGVGVEDVEGVSHSKASGLPLSKTLSSQVASGIALKAVLISCFPWVVQDGMLLYFQYQFFGEDLIRKKSTDFKRKCKAVRSHMRTQGIK
ncbi:hypothetical protein ElyMa_006111100 [Elysia marginata]|uniref:Uncharacterized protein n=1 Tax=Elysia marginata TaxID=1093978 RepID=A0AAV4GUH0_9GAST|nr:hypothetical protein ElyMa_006111100 [Elysia marginata]